MMPPSKQKRLDVRPLLARGEDPLPVIRARVDALKENEALLLKAPFLPSPLIMLLEGEGFKSRVVPGNNGEWTVYFWRPVC